MIVFSSRFSVLGVIALALTGGGCATARHDHHLAQQQEQRQQLEASIASLNTEIAKLRAELDSLAAQNDSLRQSSSRLQDDVLDREDQIRAIRLELQRLKEIDLKPRQPRPH